MFVAFLVVIFIIRIVLVKSGALFVGLLKWFLFMIEFDLFGKGFFFFFFIERFYYLILLHQNCLGEELHPV